MVICTISNGYLYFISIGIFGLSNGYLMLFVLQFIELDDGKSLTGKPDQFDGKNPWVSG